MSCFYSLGLFVTICLVSTTFCDSDSISYKDDPPFSPGGQCSTTEGQQGICTKVQNCPGALVNKRIKPKVCGFEGRQSFICCKSNSPENAVDTEKKCFDLSTGNNTPNKVRGIVGGIRSASSEFPHMVALGYGNPDDIKWRCGGTLISDNYVLTAAHCLFSRSDGDVKYIRAGTVRLSNPERTVQDFGVKSAIPHPQYKFPAGYNDIALIKLNNTIRKNTNVRPACLHTNIRVNSDLLAIGWGYLYNGGDPSNDLMKVNLVKYSKKNCNSVFSKDTRAVPNGIKEKMMICAGGKNKEEKDTCQGDSGGPLQLKKGREHIIVGITSFGKVCGTPNIPGVYTRVSNYINWIEKIVTQ